MIHLTANQNRNGHEPDARRSEAEFLQILRDILVSGPFVGDESYYSLLGRLPRDPSVGKTKLSI
jgi:hypothetical protein